MTKEEAIKWIDSNNPPDTDRRVLIWWLRATEDKLFNPIPGDAFGRYLQVLKQWRPDGCNGDWNDEVTHWAEVPTGPTA